jgi:hypothetical protein
VSALGLRSRLRLARPASTRASSSTREPGWESQRTGTQELTGYDAASRSRGNHRSVACRREETATRMPTSDADPSPPGGDRPGRSEGGCRARSGVRVASSRTPELPGRESTRKTRRSRMPPARACRAEGRPGTRPVSPLFAGRPETNQPSGVRKASTGISYASFSESERIETFTSLSMPSPSRTTCLIVSPPSNLMAPPA